MRISIILIILFTWQSSMCQDSLLFKNNKKLNWWATQVLFSELSLGYDTYLSNKIGVEYSLGYGLAPVLFTKTKLSDYYSPLYENRVIARITPKLYVKPNYKRVKQPYWGIVLVGSYEWYTHQIYGYTIAPPAPATYYDQSGRYKNINANIVRGVQRYFSQRLLFEIYYGGGINYYLHEYTRHSILNPTPGIPTDFPQDRIEKGWRISLQAGIKICLPLKAN